MLPWILLPISPVAAAAIGADLLEGARRGFAAVNKNPVFIEKYNREKWDFGKIAPLVASSGVQALLFIGSGNAVADGIDAIRKAGSRAQIVTNSNNASGGFIKSLGANARGIIVTQVFPYERSIAAPIVKEAHDLATAKGLDGVTPAMLEGFAAAKVLVAGLKRAGPNPTRAKIQQALDGIRCERGQCDDGTLVVVRIRQLAVTRTDGEHTDDPTVAGLDSGDGVGRDRCEPGGFARVEDAEHRICQCEDG